MPFDKLLLSLKYNSVFMLLSFKLISYSPDIGLVNKPSIADPNFS